MKHNSTLTLEYGGGIQEHILVIKGRPFSVLESPNIPTPNTTYIDYSLVKELGIKVANLTYEKMSYCGAKMRKIGTVAVTSQCLLDGRALGSVVALLLSSSGKLECAKELLWWASSWLIRLLSAG